MIAAAQDIYPDQLWLSGDITTWVDDLKVDLMFSCGGKRDSRIIRIGVLPTAVDEANMNGRMFLQ